MWQRHLYARMEEKLGSSSMKRMVWREDMPGLILDLMQKQLIKKLSWNFGFRGRLTAVASPRTEDLEHVDDVSCVLIVHDRAQDLDAEMDKWASYVAKQYADKLDPHAAPGVTHRSPAWFVEPLVPRLQPRIRYPELEFNSTMWRGKKVALYSLTDMLGKEKARQLIEGSQCAGEKCVVVKSVRHNVPVEILLMRLQAYVARCGP
jgi:hypothetical protein